MIHKEMMKTPGLIVYGIGIVGGCEGVFRGSIPISAVAIVFIITGSILFGLKGKK